MKLPSGVKLSGPLTSCLTPAVWQRRDAGQGQFHDLAEMVPVAVEQGVVEVGRDAVPREGFGVGLVAAHDEAADLLLVIGQAVGVAQGGQVRGHALDAFGDDVLVLHGHEGDVDADGLGEGAGPLAAAGDDRRGVDAASRGLDAADHALVDVDGQDLGVLEDARAGHAGALGERQGDVGRVGLAVGGQEGGADHVVDGHQRPEVLRFGGR